MAKQNVYVSAGDAEAAAKRKRLPLAEVLKAARFNRTLFWRWRIGTREPRLADVLRLTATIDSMPSRTTKRESAENGKTKGAKGGGRGFVRPRHKVRREKISRAL